MIRVFPIIRTVTISAEPSDRVLLERYLSFRSEEAFVELVQRHEKAVQRTCQHVLRTPVDVEDAVQATFLVLVRRARQVRWQESIRGWLIAVAHRLAVRLVVQKRTGNCRAIEKLEDVAQPPDKELSWREACAVLHQELDLLREAYRLPLLLCYMQGYSRDEAAQCLRCSLGLVKANLERGRRALKARLERRGVTLSAGLLTMLAKPLSSDAGSVSGTSMLMPLMKRSASPRVQSLVMQVRLRSTYSLLHYAVVVCVLITLGLGITKLAQAESEPIFIKASTQLITSLDSEEVRYTGTVIDQQGQPVEGARLFASGNVRVPQTKAMPVEEVAVTRAKGEFECKVKTVNTVLWVFKPGLGMTLLELPPKNTNQPLTLRMNAEQLVQGVFRNEAGLPVANANVGVAMIDIRESNMLEDQLEKARQGHWNTPSDFASTYTWLEWINSPFSVKSDAEGKFVMRGLPQGAVVYLQYNHQSYATSTRMLYLLPGFSDTGTARHKLTSTGLNQAYDKTHPARMVEYGTEVIPLYSGPTISLTLRAGATLAGTVTDSEGKPLTGVDVSLVGGNHLHTKSGPDGKYSIVGVTKASNYMISTQGFGHFLPGITSAVHREGGPIRLDMRLRRGTILKGKVIDGKTGQGVKSNVQLLPSPANPIMNKPDVEHRLSTDTDEAGNFQCISYLGEVLVVATPYAMLEGKSSPYIPAQILPTHNLLLQASGHANGRVTFHGQGQPYYLGYAYQILELPIVGEIATELKLTRGVERTLTLFDPNSNPVAAVKIAGLDRHMNLASIQGNSVVVTGLARDDFPRPLFVMDQTRRWGAMDTISVSNKPITLMLQPLGSIEARLVDAAGKPREGVSVRVHYQPLVEHQSGLLDVTREERLADFFPVAISDSEGKVKLTNLLPAMPITLRLVPNGGSRWTSVEPMSVHKLSPGEKKQIGDIVCNLQDRRTDPPNTDREGNRK